MKKKIIIISIIIVIIIIISLIIYSNNSKEDTFKSLGIDFYENFYYPNLSDSSKEKILSDLEDTGLKITLQDLIDSEKYLTMKIDSKIEKCSKEESIIYIYPKEPYSLEDYEITTKLVC